jgi:23S rRNA (cytosine1962-C5)-methyltransferase
MLPEEKANMFRNRLVKAYRHVSKLARRQGVSCYRIYDHDLPEFPFCIERYGDQVYMAEYRRNFRMAEAEQAQWLTDCQSIVSEITGIDNAHIIIRRRQRKEGRQGQYQKIDDEKAFSIVQENGLSFKINLTDYLDTGLFLDHRVTRALVREEARDQKVLNLFCYTGSFSVYAAAGGASEIVSVDLSRTYLQWAGENMALNGLMDSGRHHFVQEDVKEYLQRLPPDHFDLVILDPPTFSNSKRMKDFLDIQRDHPVLINQCLRAMRKGGTLYFSTNFSRFQLYADAIRSPAIRDITAMTTPFDFQGKLDRFCFKIGCE